MNKLLCILLIAGTITAMQTPQHQLFMEVHKDYPNVATVRSLLAQRVKPVESEELLDTAAMSDAKVGVATLLIEAGWSLNSRTHLGETPLHTAVQFFNENMIRRLVDRGADVNAQTNTKKTPLHYLFYFHKHKNIKPIKDLLLAHGANLQLTDNNRNRVCDLIAKHQQ